MGVKISKSGRILPDDENQVKNDILDFLNFYSMHVDFWRQNNGGVYDPKTKCFRKKSKYERNGVADILGFFKNSGRFLAIEVKMPGRGPSKDQLSFLNSINDAGGVAFIAHGIEDVEKNLGPPGYNKKIAV
jgi:hypothetical protein